MDLLHRFSLASFVSCGLSYLGGSYFGWIIPPDACWVSVPILYYGFVFFLFGPQKQFRWNLSKDFVLGFTFGVWMGLCSIGRVNYDHAACYYGMGLKRIHSVEGTLQQDGARKGTRVMLAVSVQAVEDEKGNKHSARFNLTALVSNAEKYFLGDRVRLRGRFIPDGEGIFVGDAHSPPVLLYRPAIACIRNYIFENTFQKGYDYVALLEALCFGIKEELDEKLGMAFRKSGTSHILALSGMHVGILVLFLQVFMSSLFKPLTRQVIIGLFLLVFCMIVGPFPSLVRAVLMYGIYTVALLQGRRIYPLDLLSHTFVLACFFFPSSVLSYSSILSYTAVGGIFLLTQPLHRCFRSVLFDPLLSAVAVSLGAQIATAPFTLYFFSRLPLFGWIASILLSPLITLFMWVGLFSILVGGVPILNPCLQGTLTFLYTAITNVVEMFAQFPAFQLP